MVTPKGKSSFFSYLTQLPLFSALPAALKSGDGGVDKAREIAEFIGTWPACRPLKDRAEMDAATALVKSLGLPGHHDHQKNWDTFKCLAYVLSLGNVNDPVLDAGSGRHRVTSRWLKRLGYRRLYACDLVPHMSIEDVRDNKITYSQQNIISTNYPGNFFQAITCIAVIEHNVELDRFVREMSRILRPGGVLAISTDYWSEPVDCSGLFPYGADAGEMKIFDEKGLREFVDLCQSAGLSPCQPVDYRTQQKAVRWDRMDREYTFAFVAFKKSR